MPITPGFDNTVRLVEGSPITATEINAELATQNAAGFWMTSLEWVNSANALLLFVKMDAIYGYTQPQKVNEVDYVQATIDADKAAEIANGWWPTGIFIRPISDSTDPTPFILYQQLDQIPT